MPMTSFQGSLLSTEIHHFLQDVTMQCWLVCVVAASKLTEIMVEILILVSLDNVATPILCIVSGM